MANAHIAFGRWAKKQIYNLHVITVHPVDSLLGIHPNDVLSILKKPLPKQASPMIHTSNYKKCLIL
jgi:hypothetical protein